MPHFKVPLHTLVIFKEYLHNFVMELMYIYIYAINSSRSHNFVTRHDRNMNRVAFESFDPEVSILGRARHPLSINHALEAPNAWYDT